MLIMNSESPFIISVIKAELPLRRKMLVKYVLSIFWAAQKIKSDYIVFNLGNISKIHFTGPIDKIQTETRINIHFN